MILRAMGLGFVVWLAMTALFRFAGQYFFYPDETMILITFIATPIAMAVITFLLLGVLHEAAIDRAEAGVALAAPGMLLDVYAVDSFPTVFPNLDPTLDGPFGALMLLAFAAVVITGLMLSRIAPSDEQIRR